LKIAAGVRRVALGLIGIAMKKIAYLLLLLTALFTVRGDDLDALQGKWMVKKTGDDGAFTQRLEIKKNKFFFKIINKEDHTTLYAEGEVEVKKQGPFSAIRFFKIRAGGSETDIEDVDEERNAIYILDNDIFSLATNFDRPRENEKPTVDAYTKQK
jgi:hypothetical protein